METWPADLTEVHTISRALANDGLNCEFSMNLLSLEETSSGTLAGRYLTMIHLYFIFIYCPLGLSSTRWVLSLAFQHIPLLGQRLVNNSDTILYQLCPTFPIA
jgi:hypothetical protein